MPESDQILYELSFYHNSWFIIRNYIMNCKVMGIVNVTPDSFSDGGQYFRPEEAVRRARNMVEEGADIIDLGGESTRPGATPLGWEEEWKRIEPVLEELRIANDELRMRDVSISIDTYHVETAERALAARANIINCVCVEPIPQMLALLERFPKAELVLPSNFQLPPTNCQLLTRLYLDPMIGFGTTREEDLDLLRSVPELAKRGRVLVGASRKRIVKKLTGEKVTGRNLGGNLAIAVWCALNGASAVRVHDVRETVQAIKVAAALQG